MECIQISKDKQDIASALFYVNKTHKPLQISNEQVSGVLISLEEWRSIEETQYLNSFPNVVKNILDADDEDIDSMINANECDW